MFGQVTNKAFSCPQLSPNIPTLVPKERREKSASLSRAFWCPLRW